MDTASSVRQAQGLGRLPGVTFEEIGLTIAAEELTHIGTLRYHCALRDDYVENEFHEVFMLRRDLDLASLALDPLEVAEVALVRIEDLERYERVPHKEEYALLSTQHSALDRANLPPTQQ